MLSLLFAATLYVACFVASARGFGVTTSGNSLIVDTSGGLVFTGEVTETLDFFDLRI